MIAFMGYSLIIVFMILIMWKKISPFVGLVFLPLVWALVDQLLGLWHIDIGEAAMNGLMTTAKTGIMLFFAIYMFTFMIDEVYLIRYPMLRFGLLKEILSK